MLDEGVARPASADGKDKDLFAETLEKIEATIEGSRTFLVCFLATAIQLTARPHRVQQLASDAATDPPTRTKPLTFMVVSVVGGSVALQTILQSLIRELGDPDQKLEVTRLATEVFRAYATLSFGQVIVEALPITVLALLMTSWLLPLVRIEAAKQQLLSDVVSYSIGLQFSLILIASVISMPMMTLGHSHVVEIVAGIVGWLVVLYVMLVPAIILSVPLRSLSKLSRTRKVIVVIGGVLISSGLVTLDVLYLLVRTAINEALQLQS
jgi:hypothetical protein